ncbi:hypothetical protein WJX81_002395 [Elliptochloris bilobata]|uniref:Uncharacterized protein n=1 Tax=Elliptochloris bilobata TaxID=381761 RepID=A0AAW1QJE5_9CHLO
MAAKLNTVGAVTLKTLRKEGGAESADLAASVALKKTVGDTAVTLRLTEATLANVKSLNGAVLMLSKALGSGVTGTAKYDLAAKSVVASLSQLRKLGGGRLLETGAVWNSRAKQWVLEAAGKPHPAHKLSATYNPHTGTLWGAYQTDVRGFTLAPSYSFAKRAGALAVTRKLSGGQTVRATYAHPDRLCVLELANKPFKVGLKTRATRDGLGPFTLGISVERDIMLGGGARPPAAKGAKPGESATSGEAKGGQRGLGPAARDPTLDDKLAALDAAFEARFAAKGANSRRLANGVDVVSFKATPKKA